MDANKTISKELIQEIPETDLTDEIGYGIETEIYVPELIVSLTEQERAILIEEFGNASVKVKEAPPKRGFINIRYEFSPEYWGESNYDSNLSREILESFVDRDMAKWLKETAKSLLEEPEAEKELKESEIPI